MDRGQGKETCGVWMEPEELLTELSKDRIYYRSSGGGITFSGGEPLLQADALAQMMQLLKESGYSICVDTAGNVPFTAFEKVLPYTDLFLYDIKAFRDSVHRRGTGVGNHRIIENLPQLLARIHADNAGGRQGAAGVWVRVPVIPGYNLDLDGETDRLGELRAVASYLASLPCRESLLRVQPLPYHAYGVGKYKMLGLDCPTTALSPPEETVMSEFLQLLLREGLPADLD